MSDVTPEIQQQVIQAVSSAHGLSEDSLQRQWGQWVAEPQTNVTAGASATEVKRWFVDRLTGLGLIAATHPSKAKAAGKVCEKCNPKKKEL